MNNKTYYNLPIELLQKIDYKRVIEYAEQQGWKAIDGVKGNITVMRIPKPPEYEILIPHGTEYDDYALRIADVIGQFAKFEKSWAVEIMHELLRSKELLKTAGRNCMIYINNRGAGATVSRFRELDKLGYTTTEACLIITGEGLVELSSETSKEGG